MKKLILQQQVSLDGFSCGPNDEMEWIFPDFSADSTRHIVEKLWDASAHLMGGKTYGDMAAFWPTSTMPMAAAMNGIPKIVFSSTVKDPTWANTRVVSTDLATELRKLKAETGKPLLAHGGVGFARSLVKTGLVDLFRLVIHPVTLGKGKSAFDAAAPLRFTVADRATFKTGVEIVELEPAAWISGAHPK